MFSDLRDCSLAILYLSLSEDDRLTITPVSVSLKRLGYPSIGDFMSLLFIQKQQVACHLSVEPMLDCQKSLQS